MPPGFEKQTAWRRARPITRRSAGIDGRCAIPTISARSEFARSTGVDTANVNTACYSPYQRDLFPGNVIPQSRMSPIGQKILSLYPAPMLPTMQQNFVASNNTGKYFYDQPMARWDRVIDDKTRVNGVLTFQHGEEYRNQNGFPGLAAIGNIHSQRTQFTARPGKPFWLR